MLKYFLDNKFDNNIALINNNKEYSFYELKKLVAFNCENLKNKKKNVVILNPDCFSFVVLFLSSIFADKNIYLLTDKTKLNSLDFDYDILKNAEFGEIDDYKFPNIDSNKTIINFYTSGSSGKSKTIKKSLYNLISEARDIGKEFDFKDKKYKTISTTSMCHLFAMTFHFMTSLVNGLIIDTKEISYPENVEGEDNILISTPSFLTSLLKYDMKFKTPPKYIISAGSKLDEKVFEKLEKDSKIIEIYGSTETGVIAHKTHYCSDFEIFKNVKINNLETGLEVISEYSYGNKATISDNVEIKGQNLKIKERLDRLFKIQEKRISAIELERGLKENEFVDNCHIIKSDDKLACLCALSDLGRDYFLKNGINNLTKHLKKHLFKYSEIIPQKWKYIDEIPMTKSGKVDNNIIEHIFRVNLSLPLILDRTLDKDTITYKILFYKQCNFFKGHFEEFHLVPGVAQLYLAKEFANYHFGLDLGSGQWKRIKFSNVIQPDDIIKLKLIKTQKNVEYEYFNDDKKYSSGAFLCENIFEKAGLS